MKGGRLDFVDDVLAHMLVQLCFFIRSTSDCFGSLPLRWPLYDFAAMTP